MMVAFLWTRGAYRNRLQDFRARILVFVILLVQLSNETISTYRSNRLPLCNFSGQVFGQGCHLSVYRDICVTDFCCAPTGLPRHRRVVGEAAGARPDPGRTAPTSTTRVCRTRRPGRGRPCTRWSHVALDLR